MQSKATLRDLRIAPRKVRLVAELIRGKKVEEAKEVLKFSRKRAAEPLEKLLHSALASLGQSMEIHEANVFIANVAVQEGAKLKRYRPRARGRAYSIEKKTSHITLVLDEVVPTKLETKKERIPERTEMKREKPQVSTKRSTPKPQFSLAKETVKPKVEGGLRRIFRRKAV